MSYTTTELIASIKSRGLIPSSQSTYQSADFLRLATEELQSHIVKLVQSAREEYFITEQDIDIVAGKASYPIPKRAIGGALRDVQWVQGESVQSLDRIELDDLSPYRNSGLSEYRGSGFSLKNNSVVIVPTPKSSQGKLRLVYAIRPSRLVEASACGLIESINSSSNQVTVTSLPITFATTKPVDIVKAEPGFECLSFEQTLVGISGTTLEFSALPDELAVGDYVCLAGESPVPQIPVELHPLLSQRVLVKVLEGLGDRQGLEAARAELKELQATCLSLITPRVHGEPKRAINTRKLSRFV